MSVNLENEMEKPVASFKINENFEELKNKLSRSIEFGLINELANNSEFEHKSVSSGYVDVYDANEYWHDFDRGEEQYGSLIRINEDAIVLSSYNTYSLGVDSFGNDDVGYDYKVSIKPNEKGGCIVSGDVEILQNTKMNHIFDGVRNEITYVPNSLTLEYNDGRTEKGNDTQLIEGEKNKINGLQEYKLLNSNYEQKVEFDADRVLSSIDPDGYTVAGSINMAVYASHVQMAGPRRDVNFCHEKMNYGHDNEIESLGFSDGKYPEDCYRGELEHEGTWTDWGYETTIPEHWSRFDADKFFNLRFEGHPISERMFDSYLKSGEKEFDNFLKPVVKQFLKNKKNGKSRGESLDAALTFIDNKNRIRQKLKQNEKLSPEIKEGMAKTKDSGYKHISRTPKEDVKTPAWMRKRQREGKSGR